MCDRSYYNEHDPFAAEWLRRLIAAGHLTRGPVDARSVVVVQPTDLAGYDRCHFFAGIGGWDYALQLAEWPDEWPIWTGSCQCQPFSTATRGRARGFADPRHLWPLWFRLIRQCRPPIIVGEQVASPLALQWLDAVCNDLEGEGYAVGAADLCAASVGAPHRRQRLYWVAIADGARRQGREALPRVAVRLSEPHHLALSQRSAAHECWRDRDWVRGQDGRWRPVEPGAQPLVDGIPGRVGRLRAYGNAIVPPLAAVFLRTVAEILIDAERFVS